MQLHDACHVVDRHNGRKFNALQNKRFSVSVKVLTVGMAFGG
jgi:hypothetical protein